MYQQTLRIYINPVIGSLKLTASRAAITMIQFLDSRPANEASSNSAILSEAAKQLKQYFGEERKSFDLPLQPDGTAFEAAVWNQLQTVPYGTTRTYLRLAKKLGDANKVRAVGKANGKNPLPVVIPCHRVIGSSGKLTGYAGGINRKKWLLKHEGSLLV